MIIRPALSADPSASIVPASIVLEVSIPCGGQKDPLGERRRDTLSRHRFRRPTAGGSATTWCAAMACLFPTKLQGLCLRFFIRQVLGKSNLWHAVCFKKPSRTVAARHHPGRRGPEPGIGV
jgi:hypothetical protein